MSTAKITSKRQITLPRDVCEELGVAKGDEIEFVKSDGVILVRRRVDQATLRKALKKLRGQIHPDFVGKTSDQIIEEMRGPVDLP